MKPELVQRNETVTLIYEVPGIALTVRGKALEGGAEGDTISVLNEQSKRTVQGVVAAPGRMSSPRARRGSRPTSAGGRRDRQASLAAKRSSHVAFWSSQ